MDTIYKNNFLNKIIIRLDFLEFINNAIIDDPDFQKELLQHWPRMGKIKLLKYNNINVSINISNNNPSPSPLPSPSSQQSIIDGMQREYSNDNETERMIVSNKCIIYEIKKYNSFTHILDNINNVISKLYNSKNFTVFRIGIRYVNLYESNKIRLQKKFFSKKIAASLEIRPNDKDESIKSIRSMHLAEFRTDYNAIINFRYGMYNRSYPNIMYDNSFVLDFDCIYSEPIDDKEKIIKLFKQGHASIDELFERSISDSLRSIMNNG